VQCVHDDYVDHRDDMVGDLEADVVGVYVDQLMVDTWHGSGDCAFEVDQL
jgi:hypothetical protein